MTNDSETDSPFRVGLNPYGVAYSVGLFGADTPRANPHPLGLNGFFDLADSIGAEGVEIPVFLLNDVPASAVDAVRARLHDAGNYAILMHGVSWPNLDGALTVAQRFSFPIIRLHLTSILCGDRAKRGVDWPRLYADSVAQLKSFARRAADAGIAVTLEDHQDLTRAELVAICAECGPNTGICFDTGNPFSVGEDPVRFAQVVAPLVRHLHLKDYRIFPNPEGFTLARCPIGDGAVPFEALAKILKPFGPLPASIEPGALTERPIRLLNDNWWNHYPERSARDFAACMACVQQAMQPTGSDPRTPWEFGADPEAVMMYEIDQLANSVANLKEMGLMR